MRFLPTRLPGVVVIEVDRFADDRGFFARTWCEREFAANGLATAWVQCNVSYNRRTGTLRGLHFQAEPHPEVKLVRCTRGAAYDVVADVRPGSPTYRQWVAVELTADNHRLVYIPAGFAHGFQTLADDTELFYQMSEHYYPEVSRGIRWDEPALGIDWPACEGRIISDRDRNLPGLPP